MQLSIIGERAKIGKKNQPHRIKGTPRQIKERSLSQENITIHFF